jgi:hypothetical protein
MKMRTVVCFPGTLTHKNANDIILKRIKYLSSSRKVLEYLDMISSLTCFRGTTNKCMYKSDAQRRKKSIYLG